MSAVLVDDDDLAFRTVHLTMACLIKSLRICPSIQRPVDLSVYACMRTDNKRGESERQRERERETERERERKRERTATDTETEGREVGREGGDLWSLRLYQESPS